MAKPRLLFIGWDAADWKVIRPLLTAGEMPNLARLIAGGVHGNMATIYPVLSPLLWTSIATGKRSYKHGIHGFSEPLPDGSGVRPVTNLSRKTKAIWNILNQNGWRPIVVGWWPSHPAEPIQGVMVSNLYSRVQGTPEAPTPMPARTVHPPNGSSILEELRVHPMELDGEMIRLFVPDYGRVDQQRDKRLHTLGKILAETMSVHAAATELLAKETWDFAAIYYDAIDHFGHAFMQYHPPRQPMVSEDDFAVYQHVVANAYRYHDAMLGALLRLADKKTTVVLMSDHGFHPDHLRPAYIPAEPAGPAVEHRHFGILVMRGPALRVGEQVFGATVLDICPTLLALCGLPPARDMDGKVLLNAFREPPVLEPVESWDAIPGDSGQHPPEARLDPVASAQAFQQLVELGYVAPPGDDIKESVEETVRELRYNLARAYRDGGLFRQAAPLFEELWQRWPSEHRFGVMLIECLAALGEIDGRRQAVVQIEERLEKYRQEAEAELKRRRDERAKQPEDKSAPRLEPTREDFEKRRWLELAQPRPLMLSWFKASQALLEKNKDEARRQLEPLIAAPRLTLDLALRIAGALLQLGDPGAARQILENLLKLDSDCAPAHARLAEIHLRQGRTEEAVAAATDSLALLYFQPSVHFTLGRALERLGRYDEAEQALRAAIMQSPRSVDAHELLGRLYRKHLNRPGAAFVHEGKARTVRHERILSNDARQTGACASEAAASGSVTAPSGPVEWGTGREVNLARIITVVSGLPRSGTSMMMQVIAAGGIEPLSDGTRLADVDNPLGYFEYEKATNLAQDPSWLPEARGKAVKIVAQLLPLLPAGESYRVVFMTRDIGEVVASQRAMLERLGRGGARLADEQLIQTYKTQLQSVKSALARRHDMAWLEIDYAVFVAQPRVGIDRLGTFLGTTFGRDAAIGAVRPELLRHKAT